MKIYLLGNIANVQTGPFGSQLHKEDYVEFGTPMVTVEHLGNRAFTKQNLPMISDSDKKRLNKYVLNEGDIVFSRVGSVDRCSYVDNKHLGWMFSGRCLRIRPCNVVYPLYLYYYFCMENTKQFIRNIAVGATMPSINTKLMKDLEVPLPTMEIQQKIASILSALDDKIELNNKINDNLRVHHSKKVQAWLEKHNDEIEVFYLPPYAPEYNPDELVNSDLKRAVGKKASPRSEKELEKNVRSHLKTLQLNPSKIASFFTSDFTSYAA